MWQLVCMKYLLKYTWAVIAFVMLSTSVSWGARLTMDNFVERNNLYYKKFTNIPFTGKVFGKESGNLDKGRKTGKWLYFYKNLQLEYKGNYKNGRRDGVWKYFKKNGVLEKTETYKNGRLLE